MMMTTTKLAVMTWVLLPQQQHLHAFLACRWRAWMTQHWMTSC